MVWDLASRRIETTLRPPGEPCQLEPWQLPAVALALSPDGKLLAAGTTVGFTTLELYDLTTGQKRFDLTDEGQAVERGRKSQEPFRFIARRAGRMKVGLLTWVAR